MIFGYVQVSTDSQKLDLQIVVFLKSGIQQKNVYTDEILRTFEKNNSKIFEFNNLIPDYFRMYFGLNYILRS